MSHFLLSIPLHAGSRRMSLAEHLSPEMERLGGAPLNYQVFGADKYSIPHVRLLIIISLTQLNERRLLGSFTKRIALEQSESH
jgi:hypothetical protein